jgi:tRNA(fMet)-specific endonuclease VapC
MARTIDAVFEGGVFKPLKPVQCAEGQRVQVIVPDERVPLSPEELDELIRETQRVFGQLSDEDWDEISQAWKRGEPMLCLWDTDVASEFLKGKHPSIFPRATAYLHQYQRATLSVLTRYEILGGLKAKNATSQIAYFAKWCGQFDFLPLTNDVSDLAADIWAYLRQTGQPIGEIDPLIAATALHHGLPLATGNVNHFNRVPGLTVLDWTVP